MRFANVELGEKKIPELEECSICDRRDNFNVLREELLALAEEEIAECSKRENISPFSARSKRGRCWMAAGR